MWLRDLYINVKCRESLSKPLICQDPIYVSRDRTQHPGVD